jgi:1-acyl-sn-glycerol-3-phosphate acyltransferase
LGPLKYRIPHQDGVRRYRDSGVHPDPSIFDAVPQADPAPPRAWRALIRLPVLLLAALLGLPVLLLAQIPGLRDVDLAGQPLALRVQRRYARILLRVLGYRLRVYGALPASPGLIVANHISGFDIPVLHAVAPLWLVAKHDIRDWPLVGFMARSVGTIFIQRGSEASRIRAARRMAALLRSDRIVGVFPEGGIHPARGVGRFHPRLFGPAIRAEAPVLPVAIRYWRDGDLHDEQVFGPGMSFPALVVAALGRPVCDVQVFIGRPLSSRSSGRNELAREAQRQVVDMYCGRNEH